MIHKNSMDNTKPTRIYPVKGLVPLNLHELWEYRELIGFMVWRDIKGRYKQTAFGPLWMLVTPILNMIVFTIIFSRVARLPSDGIPYPLFNYAALLPWGSSAVVSSPRQAVCSPTRICCPRSIFRDSLLPSLALSLRSWISVSRSSSFLGFYSITAIPWAGRH